MEVAREHHKYNELALIIRILRGNDSMSTLTPDYFSHFGLRSSRLWKYDYSEVVAIRLPTLPSPAKIWRPLVSPPAIYLLPTVDIELKWTVWSRRFCHTLDMTTKTIPEYLEDERQKDCDAQLRMEEEAARIQPLNHGHHRTAKQPNLESPSVIKPAPKARKTAAQARKKTHTARKTVTKARKAA
jgi:hypothetical protein